MFKVRSALAMLSKGPHIDIPYDAAGAQKVAEYRGIFLSTISHEIRSPLNAITGLSELVLESNLSKTHREHLLMVKHSADVLLRSMNDLVDLYAFGEDMYYLLSELNVCPGVNWSWGTSSWIDRYTTFGKQSGML